MTDRVTVSLTAGGPPILHDRQVMAWDWELEIDCRIWPGEKQAHDYPGSPATVEPLTVRARPEGLRGWWVLSDLDLLTKCWDVTEDLVRELALERV